VVKINFDLEKIILILFFAIFIFIGPGVLFDHKIQHDFPYAYGASDAFQHQIRAEAIKDAGHFRYDAAYIVKGFKDVVGTYPPVIYHLAISWSYASGAETYDAIYFIAVFFAIIASFVMYLIIRNFNKTVALFSLLLSMLIFSHPPLMGFMWGHWPSILSQSFLLLFFWAVMRMNLDKSFIIISLSLSAMALTHMPPLIFGMLFLVLFFGLKLLAKKLNKNDIKTMGISAGIFLVISFYYVIIFLNTWFKAQPYSFIIEPVWNGNPGFYIAGFGLLAIPLGFGLILSISKLKNLHVSLILAVSMLIGGFLNYVGFGFRSFQIRFFWPIYLSVFIGLGIYILFKFIIKKWNFVYTAAILVILAVLLTGIIKFPILKQTDVQTIPSIPYLNIATHQGIMDSFHWESLNWISENTETNATIYFFYGDIYNQDALLRNSKRIHYQVDPDDFIKYLQERKIKKEYITEFPGDDAQTLTYRTSFFKFINHLATISSEYSFGPRNICNFDYYVFDRASRQPVLAQYNLIIANDLIKKDFINPVFENQLVVILKNNNPGGDCIEERSF
jgi:hypothetical protein